MNYNKDKIVSYIENFVKKAGGKIKLHDFDSGAKMLDISLKTAFFVIQLENGKIGFSSLEDDFADFSTIPDKSFTLLADFKNYFEGAIEQVAQPKSNT